MRLIRAILMFAFAWAIGIAQIPTDNRFKAFYPGSTSFLDVTAGTTGTGASATFLNPSLTNGTQVFAVQVILVGGTTATGQVEGSIDGTNFESLTTSPFSMTTDSHTAVVFQSPFRFIRFNTLTNVGGGKLIALMSW